MSDPNKIRDERKSQFGLQTILDTSRLLIESHDIDFVLNNLLLISMGKMMVSRAAVLWYDPRRKAHSVMMKKGRLDLPERVTVPRELFKNRNTLFCNDHEELKPLQQHGITLLVAIRHSERHIGILALGPRIGAHPVSREEIEILESLVFMSGVAVANSELVSELRTTNRKLDYKVQELFTLFDLSKAFNASIDREEIKRMFRFTLLGQLFIRTFVMILQREGKPAAVTQNGLPRALEDEEMNDLFGFEKNIVRVDDEVLAKHSFLQDLGLHLILRLNNEGGEPAVLGLGRRANGKDYEPTDFNFLISIGNLALMSIQKTFLLEDRIEKERMEEEMQLARSIQQKLFPDTPPETPNLKLSAKNVPSYQVGGDYYDLIGDTNRNLIMAIADVTGKGIPASLLMANLQSVLHILQPFDIGLSEATGQINSLIYQNTPSDKFISFFWGRFDHAEQVLHYVNAGHNPPLLIRSNGEISRLSEGGVLLGAMPTLTPYNVGQAFLAEDDILVLYTDGVTEAMNGNSEEFDEDRLIESVLQRRDQEPAQILAGIIADVTNYCGNRITDDLTLIVCKGA